MKRLTPLRLVAVALCLAPLAAWTGSSDGPVPSPPDYADPSQWFITDRGATADLFYIISTETGDYTNADGDTCHFADTYNRQVCRGMLKEMLAVDSLFGGDCNYFAPYYRQISLQSWATADMAMRRIPVAIDDVARSWDYYLRHLNHGRPFILAGFSQGAHAMVSIMKQMPDSVASRMVAAYAIGYKVTQADLDRYPVIRPATGPTDLGVTVCYNSVRSPDCAIPIVSSDNVLCINPVNWRTDTTSTVFVNYGRRANDTLTVRCDPQSHLLIVGGYKERFVMSVIGRPGNYHNMELKFYYPYIRQNIADRVKAYFDRRETTM